MAGKSKRFAAALTCAAVLLSGASGYIPAGNKISTANAASSIIAFPGAVGGGKYATGGRGGEVYHVTNLNDSGTGSFRDAVSQSNRIVVFDVSGTIELQSNIICQSNITIAGQTAPGGSGITLKNYKFGMAGENVIVRFISSRPGPYNATSSGNDAWGGAGGGNSIVDHCSIGWASDEQWGLYSKNDNYTCQYSIIGPANSWGGHAKGVHGFGIMFGRANFSFDHNLIIHNVSRNFRGKVTDQNAADFTNNIIYDWGYQTTYGTVGHINYVNNTLKAGNSTTGAYYYANVSDNDNFAFYLSGNRILNKDNSVRNDVNSNWSAMSYNDSKSEATTRVDEHFPITVNGEDVSSVLTAESAEDAYDHVISYAGNGIAPELRTAIDQQCAEETLNGTGSCSGTAAYDSTVTDLDKYSIECGITYTYPSAVLEKTITDADNDGMDDTWELARGLDPSDPSDTNGDYCGEGYTNIEYYINDLTVNAFPEGVVTPSPEIAVDPISAFETIEAENFSMQSGVVAEDSGNGGQNVGYIENGDYIMFRAVDFEDGAKSFTARVASSLTGGTIELYIDSLNGTPVAACDITGTGGWQDYIDASFNIPTISGKHNLYLKFTGGDSYLMNIDSFVFGRDPIPMNGTLIKNLIINDTERGQYWSIAENLADGATLFGDRPVTYVSVPSELTGAEYIITSCDSKFYDSDLATFTAGADITVYVGLDSRVETPPSWLSDWELTTLTFSNSNSVIFNLYRKNFSSGQTVTLGTNGDSTTCVNYTAMAVLQTEQSSQKGDVNIDGDVNIADLVKLQQHIIRETSLNADQAAAAELNGDGIVDSFDLIAMRKLIISLQQ